MFTRPRQSIQQIMHIPERRMSIARVAFAVAPTVKSRRTIVEA